jgi:hypothetical protein
LPATSGNLITRAVANHDVRVVAGPVAQHLSIRTDRKVLRIDLVEGDIAAAVSVEPIVDLNGGLEYQILALRRLDQLLRGRPIPQPKDIRLKRLVLALRVGDALAAGASLRAVGLQILGFQDWPGDGESAKSTTRRLVQLARVLRDAGPLGIFFRRV